MGWWKIPNGAAELLLHKYISPCKTVGWYTYKIVFWGHLQRKKAISQQHLCRPLSTPITKVSATFHALHFSTCFHPKRLISCGFYFAWCCRTRNILFRCSGLKDWDTGTNSLDQLEKFVLVALSLCSLNTIVYYWQMVVLKLNLAGRQEGQQGSDEIQASI